MLLPPWGGMNRSKDQSSCPERMLSAPRASLAQLPRRKSSPFAKKPVASEAHDPLSDSQATEQRTQGSGPAASSPLGRVPLPWTLCSVPNLLAVTGGMGGEKGEGQSARQTLQEKQRENFSFPKPVPDLTVPRVSLKLQVK